MPLYVPNQDREERSEVLTAAVRDIRFATLATPDGHRVQVTHLPMALDIGQSGSWLLAGHVARANPHWKLAETGADIESVVVFQGPQAYISPSHYATKRETGRAVPTWAYITIHAHGRLEAIQDQAWLRSHVGLLTTENEAGRADPWAVDDAPADYVAGMLRGIVGLRIAVTRIEARWKMNRHRSDADRAGTMSGLEADARGKAVAGVMRALEADRSKN